MNGSSDHWKFYTASELLEADFGPYPGIENRKIGDRWGNWILRENLTLQYKFGTQDEYEIDLERITTSDEALNWIANLVERGLTSVDLGIPASIPEQYIPDLPIRLSIYHKLGRIASEADLGMIEDELVDRFGPTPWQVQNLLFALRLKLKATHSGIKTIRHESERIVLNLDYEVGGARQPLQRVLGRGVEVGHRQIRIDTSNVTEEWESRLTQIVVRLGEFRDKVTSQIQESAVVG